MDQPSSSTNLFEDNNPHHYEIRQVQQQLTIETPSSQPAHKHNTVYGEENLVFCIYFLFFFYFF